MDTEKLEGSAEQVESRFYMECLPHEFIKNMLHSIEKTHDRNSARLVCRYWYDLLNTKTIACKEAFIINGRMFKDHENYLEKIISTTLVRSKRKTINFQFLDVSLNQNLTSLLICAPRICSLSYLKDDDFSAENFVTILKHCISLEELVITYSRRNLIRSIFEDLASEGFINTNLKFLKVVGYRTSVLMEIIKQRCIFKPMFQVFPFLSDVELDINLYNFWNSLFEVGWTSFDCCVDLMLREPPCGEDILLLPHLEVLKYNVTQWNNFLYEWNTIPSDGKPSNNRFLIRGMVMCENMVEPRHIMLNTLKKHCNLRSLTYTLVFRETVGEVEEQMQKLIFFLSNCPNVRSLHLFSNGNIEWNNELTVCLAASNIKEIFIYKYSLITRDDTFPPNNVLETLNVERLPASLLSSFLNLRKLKLYSIECSSFRNICSSLLLLKDVSIYMKLHTDSNECSCDFSVVNNLKYLKVLQIPLNLVLNPKGLFLPSLDKFIVSFSIFQSKSLSSLMEKFECPFLETLSIDCDSSNKYFKHRWLIKYIVSLKNLRYLGLQPRYYKFGHSTIIFDDQEITTIFQKCPSLKLFHSWDRAYFYDPLGKSVAFYSPYSHGRFPYPISGSISKEPRIHCDADTDDDDDNNLDYKQDQDYYGDFMSLAFNE